ncbi:MAG: helix-turn-helix domain-containing protein [Christensenellaceae bacterium]|nr:helix-turn-helix domain-containing protein [Christensenellaceae bacterium]
MHPAFDTVRQLIGDIFHLSIQPLGSEDAICAFSRSNALGGSQSFLQPDSLTDFLASMQAGNLYLVTDRFQVQFVIARLEGTPVVIGPFCSLIWTLQDCRGYLRRLDISHLKPEELLAYRSRFTVISEREALHIAQSCIRLLDPASEKWDTIRLDYGSPSPTAEQRVEHAPLRVNYSELIQERYQIEQQLISDIESGNAHAAIMNLRKLQRDVDFLKKMGTTLENERVGAAIVRTMLRMSALRAGLSAPTIDLLSRQNTVATINATTVEEIYQEKENMIRQFCREIRSHQNQQYSNLVLSVMRYIEHQYAEDLSVQQIADELNVNVNHLAAVFRHETGSTPNAYIRQVRTKQAARLLASTDLSVQDISNRVGVPDANYFIKLFKKEYAMTPSEYRKYNRL